MERQHFTTTLFTSKSAKQAYNAINDVTGWWSKDFTGHSHQSGDEFEIRFADLHFSRHKLIELVPYEKVAWLVTDSHLSFLANKKEWTGTKTIFDISEEAGRTEIRFTHIGLVPEISCYRDCTHGWNQYLHSSLLPFIETGSGNPNVLNDEIQRISDNMKA